MGWTSITRTSSIAIAATVPHSARIPWLAAISRHVAAPCSSRTWMEPTSATQAAGAGPPSNPAARTGPVEKARGT